MTPPAASFPAILRIRARDLHSGETAVTEIVVDAPCDEPGQRAQIEREVHRAHPGARFKSFADSVASYLTRKQLVVAAYERTGPTRRTAPTEAPDEQAPLFAA